MKQAIYNAPTDTAAAAKVSAAFGKDWAIQHDDLKRIVGNMQDARITVKDTDPTVFDAEKGEPARARYSKNEQMTKFGSQWHADPPLHRTGTLAHELSHQEGDTGDGIYKFTPAMTTRYTWMNADEIDKFPKAAGVDPKGGCRSFSLGFQDYYVWLTSSFLDRYQTVYGRHSSQRS
jgi:hypothetical protein